MKTIIYVLAALLTTAVAQCQDAPMAQITFRVTDDDGKPLPGLTIGMATFVRWEPGEGFGKDVHDGPRGVTDDSGRFTLSYPSLKGDFGYRVRDVEGYYRHSGQDYRFNVAKEGRWEPWNPTVEVILKPIINPAPMYARKLRVEIPFADAPVGFDLVESDWVAPHGRGKVADFVFNLNRRFESWKDYYAEVKLAFSNEGDGIQTISMPGQSASELKLPRVAPEEGYLAEFTTSIGRAPSTLGRDDGKAGRSYFFRVRTVRDEKGEIVSALYGKIDGDIRIDAINSKTALLLFDYYLNPESRSRNMEFDPKRNLFTELKSTEQVTAP